MDNQFFNQDFEETPSVSPSETKEPLPEASGQSIPPTNEASTSEAEPTQESQVKSYTAPPYDRYNAAQTDIVSYYPPAPSSASMPAKDKKKVSLSTAIISSVVVSVLSSVLVILVMMYGMGLSSLMQNNTVDRTSSTGSGGPTTNIVVDTTAQTSAEAVAEKAGPSVVGIVVNTSVNYYFFGTTDSESEGSGIIYSQDGYLVTNYHVIASAAEGSGTVAVYLPEDSKTAVKANVIGYDISSDLAVLKIDKTGLTAIELGDSDNVKVGQTAIAIGNPGGMDFMGSVSKGIISGLDRTLQLENSNTEINLIQTDAAINPGNSGGALVDIQGRLIGINSAKMASDNFEGMGFAIPVNDAVKIIDRIIKNIDAPQPYLGVEISTYYDANTLQMMGYPAGVVISAISKDSPAEKAGLMRSDIVTKFGNASVTSYTEFNSEKAKYSPGDTVELTVYRRGKTYTVSITLGTANN